MRISIFFLIIALTGSGCSDRPASGVPTVSISIEAIGEPARQQAALVEDRFIHLLNYHPDPDFRIIRGIGGSGASIRGTIERIHSDTQQLQVDLILESRGKRDMIQRTFDLDRPAMQQLATLIYEKLKTLATSARTTQSRIRTRLRQVIVSSNHPGRLEVYAGEEMVSDKQLPGGDMPVLLSLDGTRGYRFVAVPFDTSALRRWESISGSYWPPQDTLVIEF